MKEKDKKEIITSKHNHTKQQQPNTVIIQANKIANKQKNNTTDTINQKADNEYTMSRTTRNKMINQQEKKEENHYLSTSIVRVYLKFFHPFLFTMYDY